MLGFLFIYFIGKYFYTLAEEYKKNKWLFAVLGVLSYYVGGFLFGSFLVMCGYMIDEVYTESLSETFLTVIVIPLGLICCYLFYHILKRNWSRNFKLEIDEIENIGRSEQF